MSRCRLVPLYMNHPGIVASQSRLYSHRSGTGCCTTTFCPTAEHSVQLASTAAATGSMHSELSRRGQRICRAEVIHKIILKRQFTGQEVAKKICPRPLRLPSSQ